MSWTITAQGALPGELGPGEAAALELDLAMAIGAVLRDPKYGCGSSSFHGVYVRARPHAGESWDAPAEPAVHRGLAQAGPAERAERLGPHPP